MFINSNHDIENLPLPKISNETWEEARKRMERHLKIEFNKIRKNLDMKIGFRLAFEWFFSLFYHFINDMKITDPKDQKDAD